MVLLFRSNVGAMLPKCRHTNFGAMFTAVISYIAKNISKINNTVPILFSTEKNNLFNVFKIHFNNSLTKI